MVQTKEKYNYVLTFVHKCIYVFLKTTIFTLVKNSLNSHYNRKHWKISIRRLEFNIMY